MSCRSAVYNVLERWNCGVSCTLIMCVFFFFSGRRRHTRCALVNGVQTCALPIFNRNTPEAYLVPADAWEAILEALDDLRLAEIVRERQGQEIGRASCRERVCQYV